MLEISIRICYTMFMEPDVQERERAFFEAERKRVPHLFERASMIDSPEFLKSIGIEAIDKDLPVGYLRLFPQDFIVEEIARSKELRTIDIDSSVPDVSQEGQTWYADLVKIGISTLDAQAHLAEILGIEPRAIGFAGIKDRLALTAQAISIRNIDEVEKLQEIRADNFFLKRIRKGKGAIANGDLQGNRFIITLRSPESFSESTSLEIRKKLQNIQEEGFWNFFSFQRFGTPRLLSHKLGLYIIKGNFEGAVRLFLAHQSQRELPYFKHIRKNIEDHWRDWATIRTLLDPFPYHFSLELKLVNHLQEHSEDFLGALQSVPDQVRLWIYAYDSYLFNKTLSRCIREGEVSLSLPLLTSFSPHDWEPYKTFLEEDGVDIPSRHYKKFPFVRVESRRWPVLQQAEIHNLIFQDKLAIFSFSLPKGSYATSLLMNFFTLASGIPVVPGISPEQIDAKNMLGLGSLRPTLDRFQKVLTLRENDLSREFEA